MTSFTKAKYHTTQRFRFINNTMEVPLLRFVREFETHIRFLQETYPSFGVYIQLTFQAEDVALTFDNESSLEENGSTVFDWTLWNAEETEIRAYDASEDCETDEGWCNTKVNDHSNCKAFVRYTPIVNSVCVNRCEVWQKEGEFGDISLAIVGEVLGSCLC